MTICPICNDKIHREEQKMIHNGFECHTYCVFVGNEKYCNFVEGVGFSK